MATVVSHYSVYCSMQYDFLSSHKDKIQLYTPLSLFRVNLALAYTELTEELSRLQALSSKQTEILRKASQEDTSPGTKHSSRLISILAVRKAPCHWVRL